MSGEGDMREDDSVQAGEYVLGLMDAPSARAFEARLAAEPALRGLVAAWEDDFAALAADIPEDAPPHSVWHGITAELFDAGEKRSIWARIGLGQILVGAAAAALIAFAVMQAGLLSPGATPEYRAEVAAADQSLLFTAEFDNESGSLSLTRVAGQAAPGRSLEIWLIAGDEAPVSVMVWPSDTETEEIVLPAPIAAALPGGTFAISDEPEGGSPTGAPTGDVLATGQVVPI
jgi:anti-sigma-K factor RskA